MTPSHGPHSLGTSQHPAGHVQIFARSPELHVPQASVTRVSAPISQTAEGSGQTGVSEVVLSDSVPSPLEALPSFVAPESVPTAPVPPDSESVTPLPRFPLLSSPRVVPRELPATVTSSSEPTSPVPVSLVPGVPVPLEVPVAVGPGFAPTMGGGSLQANTPIASELPSRRRTTAGAYAARPYAPAPARGSKRAHGIPNARDDRRTRAPSREVRPLRHGGSSPEPTQNHHRRCTGAHAADLR